MENGAFGVTGLSVQLPVVEETGHVFVYVTVQHQIMVGMNVKVTQQTIRIVTIQIAQVGYTI